MVKQAKSVKGVYKENEYLVLLKMHGPVFNNFDFVSDEVSFLQSLCQFMLFDHMDL